MRGEHEHHPGALHKAGGCECGILECGVDDFVEFFFAVNNDDLECDPSKLGITEIRTTR